MKSNAELIEIWNNLPSQEKMAMGDHYITHETNLSAWDKSFESLSELKQKRVLQSVESFIKVNDHKIIGSGIAGPTTAEQIRTIRTKAGLTQLQLSEKLGVKQQKISEWENGVYEPAYKTMMKIIEICKTKTK